MIQVITYVTEIIIIIIIIHYNKRQTTRMTAVACRTAVGLPITLPAIA